ncbi:condensation domain-containing protein [Streptomyces phaeoluteigriseus]|uniref:Condensation domain-containing protein n=1 Tax=Streptomyces phaeoluteigriseus TaxID=114686 RepID=A0ABY4Z3P9_9ACTN|nr:condensation domain-containing protein [Streptomyces phaeoluteigriseus]USQ83575.1 condensation domain-containing protein [Streptomyces phaeoluteigriseus]
MTRPDRRRPDVGTPVRRGPLQYGIAQQEWLYYRKHGRARHPRQCLWLDLPAGPTYEEVGGAVALMVERHEVLRTTFPADHKGDPVQTVWPPVPVPLQRFDLFGARPRAAELDAFCDAPFDVFAETPLRAAVFLRDAGRRQLLLVIAHIAIDYRGQEVLCEELTEALSAAASCRPVVLPPVVCQPVDHALAEAGADDGSCLDHWRSVISAAPAGIFPTAVIPEQVRYTRVGLASPALGEALPLLHREHRLPLEPVLLTALAICLATICRQPVIPLSYTWPAREPERTRRLVASVMRDIILNIDLSDAPSFVQAVHRTDEAMRLCALHSQYDVYGLLEADSLINRRRGAWRRSAVFVNLGLGPDSGWPRTPPEPHAADPRDLLPGSSVTAETGAEEHYDDFNLYMSLALGEGGRPEIFLAANRAILTESEAVSIARGIEAMLVELALADDLSMAEAQRVSGLTPRLVGEDWISLDGSWFHRGLTEEVLRRHEGVASASARVEPDGTTVAYVVTRPGGPSPAELREFLLAHLDFRHALVVPERVVVSEAAGAEGRIAAECGESTVERAVRASVREANELGDVDMSLSYVEAGGLLGRVPVVLARLRQQGVEGFVAGDFLRPCSLRTLPLLRASRRALARE